ncbi:MAG: SPOR domain-containing protein, partial [Longimicrobiales bacterium]|nr:SPOR domain-containing protein [Longimicrobiales bacterium]
AEPAAAAPQAAPPAAPSPSRADVPTPSPAGDPAAFTAQLGAFSTVGRAETLLARLAEAGLQGRLVRVPGSDLIRVRVGTFDSAEAVNAILWQLRDVGFTAVLARDAHLEEPVVR